MADYSWALQRKLMRSPTLGFNAEVRRWFADSDDNIAPGRTALRDSLLIQANESRTSAMFKVQYFREFVQKVHSQPAIIGVPKEQFDVGIEIIYKPIVTLYFQQDREAVTPGYAPVTAEISFRLMDENEDTLTKAKLQTLAAKIKNEFAINKGFTFDKGKYIALYHDKEKGYFLQIYVVNEAEGLNVVRKILSVQNYTFDEDKFRITQPKRNSVNIPDNKTILGKVYKKPRWRPNAKVRFQWANLLIATPSDPICLVDRTLSRPRPLELVV